MPDEHLQLTAETIGLIAAISAALRTLPPGHAEAIGAMICAAAQVEDSDARTNAAIDLIATTVARTPQADRVEACRYLVEALELQGRAELWRTTE